MNLLRFTRPAEGELMMPPGGRIAMKAPPKLVQLWLREYLRTLQDELGEKSCSPTGESEQVRADCAQRDAARIASLADPRYGFTSGTFALVSPLSSSLMYVTLVCQA